MFQKLLLLFKGQLFSSEEYFKLLEKFTVLTEQTIADAQELEKLGREVAALRAEKKNFFGVPIAETEFGFVGDEPQDEKAFDKYASRVSNFHEEIMQKKLRNEIGAVRSQVMNANKVIPTDTRSEYDWFLRGMEAAYWKLHEWGNTMSAHKLAKLQDKENIIN